ncbi:MAG: TonB family protein [Alphaproteobacteria bacterium]|nr:TonB family protein [Alphaproteobacteria bacterium]
MIALLTVGVALAASRAEEDAQPLGHYLEPVEIHQVLLDAMPTLSDCYRYTAAKGRVIVGEVFIDFVIDPSGEVSEARVRSSRSELPDLDACLVERVGALVFRPHHEEPVEVGYPFVYRDAALQPYPMVFIKQRELDLLFLYAPEGSGSMQQVIEALKPAP